MKYKTIRTIMMVICIVNAIAIIALTIYNQYNADYTWKQCIPTIILDSMMALIVFILIDELISKKNK